MRVCGFLGCLGGNKGTGARLPAALWRPQKLIGSICLSQLLRSPHPHHLVFFFFPPPVPSSGCCYPWHSPGATRLAVGFGHGVCVCVCLSVWLCVCVHVLYTTEDGSRKGSQAPSCHPGSKGDVGRQTGICVPRPKRERTEGAKMCVCRYYFLVTNLNPFVELFQKCNACSTLKLGSQTHGATFSSRTPSPQTWPATLKNVTVWTVVVNMI